MVTGEMLSFYGLKMIHGEQAIDPGDYPVIILLSLELSYPLAFCMATKLDVLLNVKLCYNCYYVIYLTFTILNYSDSKFCSLFM